MQRPQPVVIGGASPRHDIFIGSMISDRIDNQLERFN